MQAMTGEILDIQAAISGVMESCKQANEESSALQQAETDLPTLEQAFAQLLDVMHRLESDTQAAAGSGTGDVTEIGEYALRLQETLSGIRRQTRAQRTKTAAGMPVHQYSPVD